MCDWDFGSRTRKYQPQDSGKRVQKSEEQILSYGYLLLLRLWRVRAKIVEERQLTLFILCYAILYGTLFRETVREMLARGTKQLLGAALRSCTTYDSEADSDTLTWCITAVDSVRVDELEASRSFHGHS